MEENAVAGIVPKYDEVQLKAMKSIFSKGFGCHTCKSSGGTERYAFLSSPGKVGIPDMN